ncbi:MAG: NAD(P)-dependent oxidoreductase [Minisyncoccia bacterium]
MKEKILVTGGAGYIGSVLIPRILSEGYRVTLIDNFMYGQTPLLDHCHNEFLVIVRGDARDRTLMAEHLRGTDFILPLACLTGAPLCEKDSWTSQSVITGSIAMLLELRDRDQKIIYPTTNSGYGIGRQGVECTEKTPLNPISLYGRLKTEAEKAILDAGNCISLRLATVFGTSPRMRLDLMVNDFVYRAVIDKFLVLYEPHFKRNFIHVRDVASVFFHCVKNFDRMKDQVYNAGLGDANLSKLELCGEIKKQLPDFHFFCSEIGKDPDQRDYLVSNAKIEATGFKPKISLQDGISELIKAFQIIRRNQFSNV